MCLDSIADCVLSSTPSLVYKWGYANLDELLSRSQADYSLVLDGTLNKTCTTLLMINVSLRSPSLAHPVLYFCVALCQCDFNRHSWMA